MNWNKFHLDWPGIYLYSTFQIIPPGIQSSGMKNFGGGKQFFGGGSFHFIEVEWSGIQLELVGHMKDLLNFTEVRLKSVDQRKV